MRHTRLWILATIIACIILVGFVLSVPHTTRDTAPKVQTEEAVVPTVGIRDSYKKGVHTITGSIEAPNVCTTLDVSVTPQGDGGVDGILIALSMPEDTGICLERPTDLSFSEKVTAPADVPITVTVNGTAATVTAL